MPRVPFIRASQCFPFLKFLNQIGCPTEKLLKQVGLPFFEIEQSNNLIPEYSVWSLVEQAARFEGIEDFGLQVGMQAKIEDVGLFAQPLLRSPTLDDVLKNFLNYIRWHSSDACFWLNLDLEEAWFCRQGIHTIGVGSKQVELYTLVYMIKVIQQITGSQWQPTKVYLQMNPMVSLYHHSLLWETQIYFNQQYTAIAFPRHLLQKKRQQLSQINFSQANNSDIWQSLAVANDFTVSLAQTLETLLPHKIININNIAKLTGLSTRSLQRQLAEEGITYSDLLAKVRRKKAITLLKNSKLNLTDIALQLGYSDPANFSRAFKRWTNCSPRYFRQHNISFLK